ncbi:TetR/AcrR family transcriptional regulator [Nocardia sp. NEAU-G5]|uniref:TetR/AcrR family transcriptional regulator n=1 Tax=Nocardia albiluteola TaxID=2842303 RepID=A0ABS6B3P8_9NOCA|nr:TetR/AcrR family transcriptional regulator [Nocardia albiluteola]MBU3063839.1 TetR/AcrR family transcriptional regulator [Nocardia albiluteola]
MTSTATAVESAAGRADARRNRALVLAAAQRAFAEHGTGVSLAEIARRAGVGAGTVYRHFPTKSDLLEAVMQQRLDRMTVRANDCLAAPDVGEAFFELCAAVVVSSPRSQAVCDMITADDGWPRAVMRGAGDRFHRALHAVLVEAQRRGAVRPEVTVADVTAIFAGCVAMQRVSGTPDGLCPAARLTLDALRAHPVTKGGVLLAENNESRDETAPATARCSLCGSGLRPTGAGRPARYCSAACRQKAHRRRHRAG